MDSFDVQFWELQRAANRYKEIDPLADWPLFALVRYIRTNKATRRFENAFLAYSPEKFPSLIAQCLNGDRSDHGIIKTCKRVFYNGT